MTTQGQTSVFTGHGHGQWTWDHTQSHSYQHRVDGVLRLRRIDQRVRPENRQRRTNIRYKGKRTALAQGEEQSGAHYHVLWLTCTECGQRKRREHFFNRSVLAINRKENGCNIRCRECNGGRQHTQHGYSLRDGFVVDDPLPERLRDCPDVEMRHLDDQEWTPSEGEDDSDGSSSSEEEDEDSEEEEEEEDEWDDKESEHDELMRELADLA